MTALAPGIQMEDYLHLHPYLLTEVAQQVTTLALKLDNLSLTSGTHVQIQMQCYISVMPVVLTQDGSGRVQRWENLLEACKHNTAVETRETLPQKQSGRRTLLLKSCPLTSIYVP